MKQKQKGFTLIELLVVISIIGLLASVVLVSLSNARVKARDSKRISDLKQIQKALELYFADNNNTYPVCLLPTPQADCTSTNSPTWGTFDSLDLGAYIKKMPQDPLNSLGKYGYYYGRGYNTSYSSSTNWTWTGKTDSYMLITRLEQPQTGMPGVISPVGGAWDNPFINYMLTIPNY